MKSISFLFVFVLTSLMAPAPEPAPEPASFRVVGYHAWWMRDTWQTYDFGLLDKVMFFEFEATADGTFVEQHGWPLAWTPLARQAHDTGTAFVPTVAVLNAETFRTLFTSPRRMQALHDNTMTLVRGASADGVHLNFEVFEAVPAEARRNLTAFVRGLRSALRTYRPDAQLSIFLPGFDHGEAYDEQALAAMADFVVVQGYDMHWLTSVDAGPVAPLVGWNGANWGAILDRFLSLGVPRHKMLMAVPYYGYEWPTVSDQPGAATRGEGQPITYAPVDADYLPLIQVSAEARVAAYGKRRDPISQAPYYAYRGTDGWYQGWFEDAQSLRQKYDFVRRERLGGVAIFLLGYDAGRLTDVLRDVR